MAAYRCILDWQKPWLARPLWLQCVHKYHAIKYKFKDWHETRVTQAKT